MIHVYINQLLHGLGLIEEAELLAAKEILEKVKRDNGTVWLFGNGGSAATCSHFANDLTKMAGIRAVSLSDLTPTMLAYGNDRGWENMYLNMLGWLAKAEDCAFGISCSGNSPNVVNALRWAREAKYPTICMTGKGGMVDQLGLDVVIHARADHITAQEDMHTIMAHALARELEHG